MPIVTVDVGNKCASDHYEIITLVDGIEVSREWRHTDEILSGTSKSVKDASKAIVVTTVAPNMTAWKNIVKSKSLTIPDGTPMNGLSAKVV